MNHLRRKPQKAPHQFILTIWLLALATSSFAQFGGGGMGGGMGRRGGMGQNHSDTSSNTSNSIANSINPMPEQLTQELSSLEYDLRLTQDQVPQWMMFADKVRAYIDDQIRTKLKEQSIQASAQANPLGLQYLAQVVNTEQNKFSDLEDIQIQAKLLYPTLNADQKLLMDLRMSKIVVPNLSLYIFPTK
jgi:hypothetical protein